MTGAGEIMERDPPFFMFGVGMTLVDEAVDAFPLTEIAFVVESISNQKILQNNMQYTTIHYQKYNFYQTHYSAQMSPPSEITCQWHCSDVLSAL